MRSEDDLRAAFTAKADDAPAADQVLRAVRRAASRRPDRRRWLVPVIGVAAAAAVGVPLALAVSHSSNTSSRKAGSGTCRPRPEGELLVRRTIARRAPRARRPRSRTRRARTRAPCAARMMSPCPCVAKP